MTNEKLSPIERLAEHLCARRPCGDTPENVADWLDYSLNRCGLVVVPEQTLSPAGDDVTEAMIEAANAAWKALIVSGEGYKAEDIIRTIYRAMRAAVGDRVSDGKDK